MKRQHLPMLAIALVVGIVGSLAVGVSFSTVAFALLVLCCPLMMLLMHGSRGGRDHGTDVGVKSRDEQHPPGLR